MQGRTKRRKKLREKWFFDCLCKRCSDPTELGSHVSTLKCSNNSCLGFVVPKSGHAEDQMCSKCGLVMSPDTIEQIENDAAKKIQKSLQVYSKLVVLQINLLNTFNEVGKKLQTNIRGGGVI